MPVNGEALFAKYELIRDVKGTQEPDEDLRVCQALWHDLDHGEQPKLVINHVVGLDGLLHNSGDPNHPFVQKGVHHYENLFKQLLQRVDNDTTILAFGDHGFDQDNDHGSDTEDVMRTAMFVYQRNGFPLH